MITANEFHATLPHALNETSLPLPGRKVGKVRDGYPLDHHRRLLVTTDRLSAFDRVLACVPFKGQVLNQLSAWWFAQTAEVIPNHMISLPDPNAMIVVQAKPIPVEVVVRAYITGSTVTSLWHRYDIGEREIYGYRFPDGLQKNVPLPDPILTPTTKGGESGHDERLTCREVIERGLVDGDDWELIQASALQLFERGQVVARAADLILVDTKYEFGYGPDGRILLIDEVHTPDSSRFWKADTYQSLLEAGQEPENFDKEFVRLAYTDRGYRGEGTPPELPIDVWRMASERYVGIYELLTGKNFEPGEYPIESRLTRNLQEAAILP